MYISKKFLYKVDFILYFNCYKMRILPNLFLFQAFSTSIIVGCNRIEMKHAKLLSTCHHLHVKIRNDFIRNDLQSVTDYIKDLPPVITAAGFFQVNLKLFSSFFSILITYMIIIIQFSSIKL